MKNKGFTLIELLAVIVILLVVSIITISIIGSVIETSRENAFKDSVLSAFNAVEYYVVENELGNVPEEGIEVSKLKLKNNTFVSGRIIKNEVNQLMAEFVSNGEYCAVGSASNMIISKGECEITSPIIEVEVTGKEANIKVTDEYGLISYMITESSEEPSEWEEIEKVTSIEETKIAEQAGTYYIHVKNKYGKTNVKEYVIEQSAFCAYQPGEVVQTFNYTGGVQTFTVPCDGTYQLEVWGGSGGSAYADSGGSLVATGGKGGYVKGISTFFRDDLLSITVGGSGGNSVSDNDRWHSSATASNGGSTTVSNNTISLITAYGATGGKFNGWACGGCDEFDHDNWTAHCVVTNGGNGSGTYSNGINGIVVSGARSGNGMARITLVSLTN